MTKLNIITRNSVLAISLFLALALIIVIAPCSNSGPWSDDAVEPTGTVAPAASPPPSTSAPTPTETPTPTVTPTPIPAADPTPITTPTAAPTAESTSEPEPTSTPAVMPGPYPLQITDMLGRPVEIAAMPMRIASISPTATEMLYVAGGTAVARDSSSIFPDEVLGLPELGGAYSPSFEAIAAQRPDLILMEALSQARFLGPLSQLGTPVVSVRAASLDDITTGIRLLGQIIRNEEEAEQTAEALEARVASAIENTTGGKSALVLISDADRNLYVAKPQSYPGAITGMLQLSNPAADLPDSGTFPGFAQVSVELLLTMDPDFLFTITPSPEPAPRLSVTLPRIPGFSSLRAVTSGQLHELDVVIFLRNQGPRIAEAVEEMAKIVGSGP